MKLTYIYPDSPLVADATIRLGNYYYKKQSFKIAGEDLLNFQQKNPTHRLAAEALFLPAQCNYKLADFKESVRLFQKTADEYPDDKNVRPEAMYWLADCRREDQRQREGVPDVQEGDVGLPRKRVGQARPRPADRGSLLADAGRAAVGARQTHE